MMLEKVIDKGIELFMWWDTATCGADDKALTCLEKGYESIVDSKERLISLTWMNDKTKQTVVIFQNKVEVGITDGEGFFVKKYEI